MPRDYHRNHIVSASYLAGFADPDGNLCVVGKDDNSVRRGRPRTMGFRPAFWGKDRQVRADAERWLSALESDIPEAVRGLLENGVPAPGSEQRLALMLLLAMHGVRNPSARENVLQIQQRAIAEHAGKYQAGISLTGYEDLLRLFTSDAFVAQVMLGHVSKLASFLGSMHWTLVEFDHALLATSDEPTVLMPVPGATALADTYEARFAVDPRHALILAWVDVPDDGPVVRGDDALAAQLNRGAIAQADQQWFHHPARRPVCCTSDDILGVGLASAAERIHAGYDVAEARSSQRRVQAIANMKELIERQTPGVVKTAAIERATA